MAGSKQPHYTQTELWVEKYRPLTLNEIVGQNKNLQVAREWIESFKNRDPGLKRALLLSGPPGLGKTTLAHCLLKEYGFLVKEYNASDIRSQKLVEENLNDIINVDYVDKIYGKPIKKFGIIMDEVDGMMSGDRGGLSALNKFINPFKGQRSRSALEKAEKYWGPPIICICNYMDRKIQDLRKDCLEIKFERPQSRDLTTLVNRIVKAEKLQITEPAKKLILKEIAQGDFRRLVFFLQYLYQLYGKDQIIDLPEVENSREIFAHKEQDLNMYENIDQLLNQKLPAPTVMRIYNNDKSLLPLMIHENYPRTLNLQAINVFKQLDRLQKTIQSILAGDLIDKAMYTYQCWYLQPIHGLFSCLIPSYQMNLSRKSTYCRNQFTTALSRYSIACTNQKTIIQLQEITSDRATFSTDHIHHFSRLISYLLWNSKIDTAVKLMHHYGLQVTDKDSDLDRLVRVDRFRNKKEIPVRIKNQLITLNNELLQIAAKKPKIKFLNTHSQGTGVGASAGASSGSSAGPDTNSNFVDNTSKIHSIIGVEDQLRRLAKKAKMSLNQTESDSSVVSKPNSFITKPGLVGFITKPGPVFIPKSKTKVLANKPEMPVIVSDQTNDPNQDPDLTSDLDHTDDPYQDIASNPKVSLKIPSNSGITPKPIIKPKLPISLISKSGVAPKLPISLTNKSGVALTNKSGVALTNKSGVAPKLPISLTNKSGVSPKPPISKAKIATPTIKIKNV